MRCALLALLLLAWPTAAARAAETYDMHFQFEQRDTPALHSFRLKWTNADSNLQSIEVLLSGTSEIVQTIAVPQDRVKLIYKDLTSQPERIRDTFFAFEDYNFDKYGDLRLTAQWPYKVGEKKYLVWIFNQPKNQYELNEAISALGQPMPNERTQRIESITFGGWAGAEYTKQSFSLTSKGNLKLQTTIKQAIHWPERMVFQREVRQRVQGEMQRVCRILIPPEGVPQLIWGTKGRCAYHMKKHDL